MTPEEQSKYETALKKVKKIKGFYSHLLVYIVINAAILIATYSNINSDQNFWKWQTFNTVFFWGIGITAHGLSVFGRNLFFSQNWEENKIKELMEKEKSEKWE